MNRLAALAVCPLLAACAHGPLEARDAVSGNLLASVEHKGTAGQMGRRL